MKKILIVDDDAEFRDNLTEALTEEGYQARSAASVQEAVERSETAAFDIILLDFMMPKISGLEALFTLRRVQPKAKVIMITAFSTVENAVEAIKKGASDYISKPFKIETLLTTIRRVLEEAKFELCLANPDLDRTLSSLANPIRRNIVKLLHVRGNMQLMEITRELKIDDHTKVVFHLKLLKEAGIIEQNNKKSYSLAPDGTKAIECLRMLEDSLQFR
ncbi:MAG: response regulator [Syntrophobacterales bacterium]|nr:response regulator [Syntrophobacterales bacterium]